MNDKECTCGQLREAGEVPDASGKWLSQSKLCDVHKICRWMGAKKPVMKKYNPDAKCVKCGGSEISDRHVDAYEPSEMAIYGAKLHGNKKPQGKPERIIRKCKTCCYEWKEAPMDTMTIGDAINESAIKTTCPDIETLARMGMGMPITTMTGPVIKIMDCEHAKSCDTCRPINDPGSETHGKNPCDIPVIEVGDVVENSECDVPEKLECKVIGDVNAYVSLQCCDSDTCVCNASRKGLTIIRKGPKVHRFEGVNFQTDTEGYFTTIHNENDDTGFMEEMQNGKIYTIIATQEDLK